MKKIISTFLLFFTILLPANPVDITKEFCTTTNFEMGSGFKIFSEKTSFYKRPALCITIKNQSDGAKIGEISYSKKQSPDKSTYHNVVESIAIEENFQSKGYGSLLLKYALAQCSTKECLGTNVFATTTNSSDPNDYKRLKAFYIRAGGILENNSETKLTGRFNFPSHYTEKA